MEAVAAAAKEEALATSVAAVSAKEEALATSLAAAAAAKAKEARAAAKEAVAAAAAAQLNAEEAAVTASAAELNAEQAAARASAAELDAKDAAAVAAIATAAVQASKKRKFHLIVDGQDLPVSGNVHDGDLIDDQDDPPVSGNFYDQGLISRLPDAVADFDLRSKGHRTAGEASVAAAMQASSKHKFHLVDPRRCGNFDDADFISRLPDKALRSIVSLLPTKDGARTQAISRRWRPLWRSAPLNLVVGLGYGFMSKGHVTVDCIPKILSEHPGPARRFLLYFWSSDHLDKIEGWLGSQALDNLQELELTYSVSSYYGKKLRRLPSSAYRFAPTLRFAKFYGFRFLPLSIKFPCLKQLTLGRVTLYEGALRSIFSGCPSLESLELKDNFGIGRLCISSQTLKSLGFSAGRSEGGVFLHELVIQDAPCLERLLPLDPKNGPATIKIISAPKLKILGVLSDDIPELHFGTTVFQNMIAVGLTTKMYTVRVLALHSAGPNLGAVVNLLKCFPYLERLHVSFQSPSPWTDIDKVRKYGPIECLELRLKKVVLKNYDGTKDLSVDFAKFFVLNAKVLKEMKITLPYHRQHNWFADQHRMLRIKDRASRDAQIELKCGTKVCFTHNKHTHDLSMADPFDMPSSGCFKCMELMRKKSLLL